nr:hypothetical protein [Kutzneria sp. 744]
MHILVTESAPGASRRLVGRLRELGCRVSACHDSSTVCRAVAPGGGCPLDGAEPAGIVVDVRDGAGELTAREYGVVCGVRARRQVVFVDVDEDRRAAVPTGMNPHMTAVQMPALVQACADALRTEQGR